MHTDRCGNTADRNVKQKEAEKKLKYKGLCREIRGTSGINWSHRNGNKSFKDKFGSHIRKAFNRLTTKYSCTWNITHNTEITAVWNLKPERWGSPLALVREKYQEEKACDKRQQQQQQHNNNNNNNNNNRQNRDTQQTWPLRDREGACLLTDACTPADRILKKETRVLLKYADLLIDVERMWNIKVKAISGATVAAGSLCKSLQKWLGDNLKNKTAECCRSIRQVTTCRMILT